MTETFKRGNRKHEFMITALELFYQKGYENTTIKDIIDELGVSKGAFYHYFESKEDVIISIAREFTQRTVRIMKEIFERPDLTAVEKLNRSFESINEYKIREAEWRTKFKKAIQSEENLKLQHTLLNFMKQDIIELYAGLIDSGAEEGVFDDPINSRELADFLINITFILNTSVHELENDYYNRKDGLDYEEFLLRLEEKVYFYEVMLERAFQLRKGKFDLRTPYLRRAETIK